MSRRRPPPVPTALYLFLAAAALGNRPSEAAGSVTYEWTALDNLEKAVTSEGPVEFSYDGDGQRITKAADGEAVVYVRDGAGNVIAEYDEAGDLLVEYVYVGARRIARISGGGSRHYYHGDPVGTPLVITDEGGSEAWRGENRPFGQEERSSTERDDKRKFTGKELDLETGLSYFGARYYSAELGRFLSTDPAKGSPDLPMTWNRYSYARNNPLRLVDPDGREEVEVWAGPSLGLKPFGSIHFTGRNIDAMKKATRRRNPNYIPEVKIAETEWSIGFSALTFVFELNFETRDISVLRRSREGGPLGRTVGRYVRDGSSSELTEIRTGLGFTSYDLLALGEGGEAFAETYEVTVGVGGALGSVDLVLTAEDFETSGYQGYEATVEGANAGCRASFNSCLGTFTLPEPGARTGSGAPF